MTWREVGLETFGSSAREYVRTAGGIVWRFDAHLGGVATTAASASEALSTIPALARVGQTSRAPLDLVMDLRRAVITSDNASVLVTSHAQSAPMIAAFGATAHRQAGLFAPGWATAYFKAINLAAAVPWQTEVFEVNADLWAWLGTDPSVAAEVDALIADRLSQPDVGVAVSAALRAEPGLALGAVARVVGLSARSLQRALAASGTSFLALRNELRMERALALLARDDIKLEAIAHAVGFASTTHFTTWFRSLRGITPSLRRDAR